VGALPDLNSSAGLKDDVESMAFHAVAVKVTPLRVWENTSPEAQNPPLTVLHVPPALEPVKLPLVLVKSKVVALAATDIRTDSSPKLQILFMMSEVYGSSLEARVVRRFRNSQTMGGYVGLLSDSDAGEAQLAT